MVGRSPRLEALHGKRRMLDRRQRLAHKARNALPSLVLVGGIGLLTGCCAWLLWGTGAVVLTAIVIALLYVFAPRVPPEVVMRMYRASKLDPRSGAQIIGIVTALSRRAGFPAVPDVYIIPSRTLNAFATGRPEKTVVGITEALLRTLTPR